MSTGQFEGLGEFSIEDLFRVELDTQLPELTRLLLELESGEESKPRLEALMRGAHCLKGAARIADFNGAVKVSHAMEDCFVAAIGGKALGTGVIDLLLGGIDLLRHSVASAASDSGGAGANDPAVEQFLSSLAALSATVSPAKGRQSDGSESASKPPRASDPPPDSATEPDLHPPDVSAAAGLTPAKPVAAEANRALRVSGESLTRLLSLAGESQLTTRWVETFRTEVLKIKSLQAGLARSLESAAEQCETSASEPVRHAITEARLGAERCVEALGERLEDLNEFDRRTVRLSSRLHREVLNCRMRPFQDGISGLPRMVRDISRTLGKQVTLEIRGDQTPVDRDILERLETAIAHLVRNAIDHGFEDPEERLAAGKPSTGRLLIVAEHASGTVRIRITDDGRGIDPEHLRSTVVRKEMVRPEVAPRLSKAELLDFIFLPGFTSKDTVSEISGRGFGLDAVQTMIRELGGKLSVRSQPGKRTTFEMNLPLTQSVVRTLVVDVGGEPYAFPLGKLFCAIKVPLDQVESVEGRQHFVLGKENVGLISANQVLQLEPRGPDDGTLHVVVLGTQARRFGLVVDRFVGQETVLVKPLDPRLGKVKDLSAAGVLSDGRPVLIFDEDDLLRSIEILSSGGWLMRSSAIDPRVAERRKRILVVDDSFTVRELERKVLLTAGYEVAVAVDGLDGWNAVRADAYDLVVTDVDMPRLDGIELVRRIRADARLSQMPVIIVSFKDREEDRIRGMSAGADYYLTKSSFEDKTLRTAVVQLIGESAA